MHSFNSPRPSHTPPPSPQSLRRPPTSTSRAHRSPHCECSRVGTFVDARGCPRGCGTDVWHRGVVRGAGRFNETRPPPSPPRARLLLRRNASPIQLSRFSRHVCARARMPMRLFRCGVSAARQCSFGNIPPENRLRVLRRKREILFWSLSRRTFLVSNT